MIQATGINTSNNIVANKTMEKKSEVSGEPKDSVQIENTPKDDIGLIHKTFRGFAKLVGGTAGIIPGATTGIIKDSATEDPVINISPKAAKINRTIGAAGGLVIGTLLAIGSGPIGWAAALVGGPILGSAFAGAFPGAVDAGITSVKGAAKGAYSGALKGSEIGGAIVDKSVEVGKKVASWF